ncbi:ABC transporter ATP-binding protein [Thermohalobaculum xanthum]|uniref:ABC transporter ATP-binding protein n=1 Tax=Thermohalobaculum xanthum TaxID=2753746 RepID=UPI0038999066
MTPAPGIRIRGTLDFGDGYRIPGLDLDVPAGQWTCLLGPSGVGKSTLLRLIAGLDAGGALEGEIAASDGRALAGRIAWMGQSDLLAPWLDVAGNVGLGARLRGERADPARIEGLIAEVGLAGHKAKRPPALSGGMRQRVALARTLMEDRPVALLDEPFSALDARTRAEMQELAFRVLAGRTVLIVTHDPAEAARLGHQIHVMTEIGLSPFPAPAAPPIRPAGARETLEAQAALLAALRAPGAVIEGVS